jgi:hypothetical protein
MTFRQQTSLHVLGQVINEYRYPHIRVCLRNHYVSLCITERDANHTTWTWLAGVSTRHFEVLWICSREMDSMMVVAIVVSKQRQRRKQRATYAGLPGQRLSTTAKADGWM